MDIEVGDRVLIASHALHPKFRGMVGVVTFVYWGVHDNKKQNENEEQRVTAEQARVAAENLRIHAEDVREGMEHFRQAGEKLRLSMERARVGFEAVRREAEKAREEAEKLRHIAEEARQVAEEARQVAVEALTKSKVDDEERKFLSDQIEVLEQRLKGHNFQSDNGILSD